MVKFAGIAIVWAKKDIFKVKDTFQSYKEIKEIKFTHLGKKVKKLSLYSIDAKLNPIVHKLPV